MTPNPYSGIIPSREIDEINNCPAAPGSGANEKKVEGQKTRKILLLLWSKCNPSRNSSVVLNFSLKLSQSIGREKTFSIFHLRVHYPTMDLEFAGMIL